ncbi:CBO0543 family protein [Mesobacillus foraminis]|uniref:CBO0543 family protein n=1 Tax=Mesobacillus foraminis TaxID=279826 RepID=UPI0039A0C903
MNEEQSRLLESLREQSHQLGDKWVNYWQTYSYIDTWQFWLNLVFLVLPLIILYFKLDKSRALQLGFFGFSGHVLSTYVDSYSTRFGHWEYPYQVIPVLPLSIGLDTSLIPVAYMLVYQWTIHHKKNYYIATTILAAFFAFIFKPILSALHLFQLSEGNNYFHVFLWYFLGGILSKWVTNIFLRFEREASRN